MSWTTNENITLSETSPGFPIAPIMNGANNVFLTIFNNYIIPPSGSSSSLNSFGLMNGIW